MIRRVFAVKHFGTLIPTVILLSFGIAAIGFVEDQLTWERPLAYFVTGICLLWGLRGIIYLIRRPAAAHPSVFVVAMMWQKVMFFVIYLALFLASVNVLYPSFIDVPDSVLWMLFIGCSCSVAFVNLIMGFSNRGWIEQETDAVPFRSVYRALRTLRKRKRG